MARRKEARRPGSENSSATGGFPAVVLQATPSPPPPPPPPHGCIFMFGRQGWQGPVDSDHVISMMNPGHIAICVGAGQTTGGQISSACASISRCDSKRGRSRPVGWVRICSVAKLVTTNVRNVASASSAKRKPIIWFTISNILCTIASCKWCDLG